MKKIIFGILSALVGLYFLVCIFLFYNQEKLIFFPQKTDKNYKFSFEQKLEEIEIKTKDNIALSGLLFKSDSSKGLIFYLHGNGGSINSWGNVAKTYTDLGFDVFMLDYRGYGKSEGSLNGQSQFFEDVQIAYDEMKKKYAESKIIVLGYSIGTGLAAKVASTNNPKLLILQAPYYSLIDMMRQGYPLIPTFILKYKFETNQYIKNCKTPIVIFHGDQDKVVYYGSSLKLQKELKKQDTLITLVGQGHNDMSENSTYKIEIQKILSK